MADLDIIMPVYNEGGNIESVAESLLKHVNSHFCLMICYDFDEDDTLPVLRKLDFKEQKLRLVKNRGEGAHGAIMTGLEDSTAPTVLVMPADDDYNATRIDAMLALIADGNDIVTPCRFMPGGCYIGCGPFKGILTRTAAFVLRRIALLPSRDATNGFRMYSRRVLESFTIESTVGFSLALELIVKAHRSGFSVAEYPAEWHERDIGASRFHTVSWIPQYLIWLRYALITTYLRKNSVETALPDRKTNAQDTNSRSIS